MTEDELRLFSEFLEQREFDEDRYSGEGGSNEHPHKPVEKMSEEEYNNWLKYSDKFIPDYAFEPKQHRLSKEAYELKKSDVVGLERHTLKLPETREKVSHFEDKIKRLEEENQRLIKKKDKELNDHYIRTYKNQLTTYYKPWLEKELYNINGDTLRLMDKEDNLADTGYDDKYSSRAAEILTKGARRRGTEAWIKPWKKAEKIVDNRLDLAQKYERHDSENPIDSSKFKGKVKETFRDVGRKWDDASMVYDVSTDGRSLGKDAAIAAGATAALVGGGIALRKHLKKKKQEEEIAEKKYKTSDKKKK